MSDARRESPLRRVREWACVLCTLWLVVQNSLLFLLLLAYRNEGLDRALAATARTLALVTPLWAIPAAALCGLAIATALARGTVSSHEARRWEVDHGRAR